MGKITEYQGLNDSKFFDATGLIGNKCNPNNMGLDKDEGSMVFENTSSQQFQKNEKKIK